MAQRTVPVKNVAFTFFVCLPSAADPTLAQVNPTLAAGDVKVQTDDGSLGNITTLPTGAAASKRVKVSLSADEMNGDNIWVQFSDAAGAEWKDACFNIQTSARGIDDLAFPATTGRSLVVSAGGAADAQVKGIDAGAVSAAAIATDAIDADALKADAVTEIQAGLSTLTAQQVWEYGARSLTTFGTLVADAAAAVWAAVARTLTANPGLTAAQVNAEADAALADYDAPTRAEATADKDAVIAAMPAAPDNAGIAAILDDTGTSGVVVAAGSKAGYSLGATGLDAIPTTEPAGVASTFREMLVQTWRRFFKRATMTSTQAKTFGDDGTTVRTTQPVSDDGTTQEQGPAS